MIVLWLCLYANLHPPSTAYTLYPPSPPLQVNRVYGNWSMRASKAYSMQSTSTQSLEEQVRTIRAFLVATLRYLSEKTNLASSHFILQLNFTQIPNVVVKGGME